MKNKTTAIAAILLVAIVAGGCGMFGGANSNATKTANGNKPPATPEVPAIEITGAALGQEWLANPAATDTKYKGKVLSITGELYLAQHIGDQAFIDLVGIPINTKDPNNKSVRISCGSAITAETQLLVKAREANDKMMSENPTAKYPPQPTLTVKGTYKASADRGIIDVSDCKLQSSS